MPDLQARISYPGIRQYDTASITLAHGITASRFVLNIAPQSEQIELQGDLVLEFGNETARFSRCRVDLGSLVFSESGQILSVTLADRRIDWAGGAIFGRYNVRHVNNQIYKEPNGPQNAISDPERTPAELATLLLEDLGEQNFDVSALEAFSDARPPADWQGDPPARLLGELVSMFACRIVLGLDDIVRIVRDGVGSELPGENVMYFEPEINKNKGRKYGIGWGPTRWQVDIPLEEVGLDYDDQVKLLDDLSYKPSGGWDTTDPVYMDDFTGHDCDLSKALLSVRRWFRPKVDPPLTIGGMKIEQASQIVLSSVRVELEKVDGVKHPKRAIVWGKFFDEGTVNQSDVANVVLGTSPPGPSGDCSDLIYKGSWSVDTALNIVQFGEPIYDRSSSNAVQSPTIYIRCAVMLRDPKTGALICGLHPPDGNPVDTTPDNMDQLRADGALDGINIYAQHSEISRAYIVKPDPPPSGNDKDNIAKVTAESTYYRDALQKVTNDETLSGSARYAGWIFQELDGALQSITWTLTRSGATTIIQRNDDKGSPTQKSYKDRRADEESKLAAARIDQRGRVNGLFGIQLAPQLSQGDFYKYPGGK